MTAPTTIPTEAIISITDLHKSFDNDNKVLNGITLTVNEGENLVILGRSGSGKSLTIQCAIGLVKPTSGSIKIFGIDITTIDGSALNAIRVKVGFLFQSGALYDSMTVRENLSFPLKKHHKNLSKEEVEEKVQEALTNVGLLDAIDKMPVELSGGMRKRVALARTLILKPAIILYDEPTTGLDSITAKEIGELILTVRKTYNTSAIIITHDMACAKLTGDRLCIIKDGVIAATGTYAALANSDDAWVRSFFI